MLTGSRRSKSRIFFRNLFISVRNKKKIIRFVNAEFVGAIHELPPHAIQPSFPVLQAAVVLNVFYVPLPGAGDIQSGR